MGALFVTVITFRVSFTADICVHALVIHAFIDSAIAIVKTFIIAIATVDHGFESTGKKGIFTASGGARVTIIAQAAGSTAAILTALLSKTVREALGAQSCDAQ
jgi:hypothetical protein